MNRVCCHILLPTPTSHEFSNSRHLHLGVKLSKRRLKKLQRRKRRKAASIIEPMTGNPDDNYSDCDVEAEEDHEILVPDERLPTLEELVAPTSGNEEKDVVNYLPVHQPFPTPQEWRRDGEHTFLPIPEVALESIEKGRAFFVTTLGYMCIDFQLFPSR